MKLRKLLDNPFKKYRREKGIRYSYRYERDVPDIIEKNVVYLVGEKPYLWAAIFKCPCGCKADITLNLLRHTSPCWSHSLRWRQVTISPSIWRKVGCRSHFHIIKGRVRWSSFK